MSDERMTRIEPAPSPQRIHVPPGSLYTGLREYACDGAVLKALVEGTPQEPRVVSCQILELHDLNVGQRRTSHDVGAFLRRCLRRIKKQGLILVLDEQIVSISADRISVQKIRFQQFCSRGQTTGPFSSTEAVL